MTEVPSPLAELEPARVCIIKPSSLGDVVHALPILAALRARWPAAHLAWVVNRPFRELLDGHPALDELIVHDRSARRAISWGLSATTALFRKLSQSRFDLTIDLQGLLRSAFMTAATRSPVRVGPRRCARRGDSGSTPIQSTRRACTCTPSNAPGAWPRPLAQACSSRNSTCRFPLPRPVGPRKRSPDCFAPRIVLNVGARWLTKRWPPEHFAEVGRRLVFDVPGRA